VYRKILSALTRVDRDKDKYGKSSVGRKGWSEKRVGRDCL